MTAHAMAGARAEYLVAGMDDYISKPVDSRLLLEKLDRIAGDTWGVTQFAAKRREPPPDDALDRPKLVELFGIMSASDVDEIVRDFLTEAPRQLSTIKRALDHSDWVTLQREAHTLSGSAGNIGLTALGTTARQLMTALSEKDFSNTPRLVQELVVQSAKATVALTKWRTAEVEPRLKSLA
jgi:HPt (histidine-containing phosphotransfer) domain-containing protein